MNTFKSSFLSVLPVDPTSIAGAHDEGPINEPQVCMILRLSLYFPFTFLNEKRKNMKNMLN